MDCTCVAVDNSLSADNASSHVPTKAAEFNGKHMKRDVQAKCSLSHAKSNSCDHNGGVLTSKYGDLKVTIPECAINNGDSITVHITRLEITDHIVFINQLKLNFNILQ